MGNLAKLKQAVENALRALEQVRADTRQAKEADRRYRKALDKLQRAQSKPR